MAHHVLRLPGPPPPPGVVFVTLGSPDVLLPVPGKSRPLSPTMLFRCVLPCCRFG